MTNPFRGAVASHDARQYSREVYVWFISWTPAEAALSAARLPAIQRAGAVSQVSSSTIARPSRGSARRQLLLLAVHP
jgi:hypothetical protein